MRPASRSENPSLREWLQEAPFALAMSSGFFGFFAHAGMLSALESEHLLPERVSGSSAGALITGLWAAGVDAGAMQEALLALQRKDFWDPAPGLGMLRGRLFRQKLENLVGACSLERCRVPVAISVFDVLGGRTQVLSTGPVAPAIHASCALPVFFQPVRLGGRLYSDGGITDRAGMAGLPPNGRVLYHHLASRSPWRRRHSPALRVPVRDGLAAVVVETLPRVNPFALERGKEAYLVAREGMRLALDRPYAGTGIRVAPPA